MNLFKKLLSILMACVFLVATFSGCKFFETSSSSQKDVYDVKIIATWTIDQNVKYEFLMSENGTTINLPKKREGSYLLTYIVYKNGIASNYEEGMISAFFEESYDWMVYFSGNVFSQLDDQIKREFIINVKDYRIRPTLVIDANGAIKYTNNKKYVYKYDGKPHCPKGLYCVYEDEILEISGCSRWIRSPWNKFISEEDGGVIDVGVYTLELIVYSKYYIDLKNRERCFDISISVVVEIIN